MAIRHGNVGMGDLTMALANQAGQAVAARRAAELAEQLRQRELDRQFQREQFEQQLAAQQAMKQIDFQMEMEKYRRAQAWEIEKMELRSRLDFEHEEKMRQQRLAEFAAQERSIDDAVRAGQISEDEARRQKSALQYGKLGLEGVAAQMLRTETNDSMLSSLINDALSGSDSGQGVPTTGPSAQATTPAAKPTTVAPAPVAKALQRRFNGLFIADNGQLATLDEATGKTTTIDPNKHYTVVRINPETGMQETGIATGKRILERTEEVLDLINEYSPTNATALQQQLADKFMGTMSVREYELYTEILNKPSIKKLPPDLANKVAMDLLAAKKKDEEQKEKRKQLAQKYGDFGYLRERFPNF